MKNLKVNKIIIVLAVVLAVILGLTISVKAEEYQSINPSDVITTNGTSNGSNNSNARNNSNASNNSNSNKNAISYNNTNVNNNTNLPKTGLTDYSVLFVVIGALAIIGIVAYKKASYYKDI